MVKIFKPNNNRKNFVKHKQCDSIKKYPPHIHMEPLLCVKTAGLGVIKKLWGGI
jgi:hypothetical protein